MPLKDYKKKRDFKKTPEPSVKENSKKISKSKIFVVHEHHASHLHWDLRLEMNRVLKSWAVPKQPPTKKGLKRLAIAVEDHPLSYAKFEGEIPEGNYGAGKVKIWDEGTYELTEEESKAPKGVYPEGHEPRNIFKKMFTKGKIEVEFHGKKLKGKYVLIKTNYGNKPEKSWLFFKL